MVGWGEEKEGGEDSVSEQQLCTCRLGGASRQHDCSWESECPNLTHQECRFVWMFSCAAGEWSRVFLGHVEVNSQRQYKAQVVQLE